MANVQFNMNEVVNTVTTNLSGKIGQLEVEKAQLQVINAALNKRVDELEAENKKIKDEQAKNVKADKKVKSNAK